MPFFFSFLAMQQHMEFLGQDSPLSHSCHLCCSCNTTRSLTQCPGWDWACIPVLRRCCQSCCARAGWGDKSWLKSQRHDSDGCLEGRSMRRPSRSRKRPGKRLLRQPRWERRGSRAIVGPTEVVRRGQNWLYYEGRGAGRVSGELKCRGWEREREEPRMTQGYQSEQPGG